MQEVDWEELYEDSNKTIEYIEEGVKTFDNHGLKHDPKKLLERQMKAKKALQKKDSPIIKKGGKGILKIFMKNAIPIVGAAIKKFCSYLIKTHKLNPHKSQIIGKFISKCAPTLIRCSSSLNIAATALGVIGIAGTAIVGIINLVKYFKEYAENKKEEEEIQNQKQTKLIEPKQKDSNQKENGLDWVTTFLDVVSCVASVAGSILIGVLSIL